MNHKRQMPPVMLTSTRLTRKRARARWAAVFAGASFGCALLAVWATPHDLAMLPIGVGMVLLLIAGDLWTE